MSFDQDETHLLRRTVVKHAHAYNDEKLTKNTVTIGHTCNHHEICTINDHLYKTIHIEKA